MNKTMKKLLSIVMIVMMVLSAVPMTASAGVIDDIACAAGNHTYAWKVTQEATCTATGAKVNQCTNCNAIKESATIEKLAHTPKAMEAKPATCTEGGNTAGTVCAVCGAVIENCEPIPATGHKPEDMPAIDATCETNGLTKGSKCSACQTVLAAQTSIPATGHKWTTTSYTAPTCTTKGSEVKTCSTCKKVDTTILDVVHIYGSWKVETAPSCEAAGTMIQTCTQCKAEVVNPIPATGHTEIAVAEKAPTCTEAGASAGKKCSTCEKIIEGCTYVAPTGHTSTKVEGYAATCTTKGLSDGYYCPKCNFIFTKQAETPELGHSMAYDAASSKTATCTETGLSVMKCTRIGCTETTSEVIPVTHKVNWTVAPAATCTTDGKQTGYCSVCKQTVTEVIPATGHKVTSELAWKVKTEATCTKDGVQAATCSVCGKEATRAIPKTGHKEVVKAGTPATCTKPGLTDGKWCEYCGEDIAKQEVIPVAEHTYGEWTVIKAATCAAVGTKEATCTVCKKKTTESIERTAHTEKEIPAKSATCTEPGNEAGLECSVCGAIVKEATVVPALDHNWVDSGKSVAATCTTDGVDDYKCSRCTETKTGVVPATGHKNTETIKGTPADCTLSGVQDAIKCNDCGQWVQEQVEIPALGHDMIVVADKSTAATCEKEGVNFLDCSRCDVTEQQKVEKLEHAWGAWVVDTAATCNTSGSQHRACASCNLVETETIPGAGGCNIVTMDPVAATCTEPGLTGGTHCTNCLTVYTQQTEIPALGHHYFNVVEEATIEKSGQVTSTCENCGDSIIDVIDKIATIKLSSTKVTYNGNARNPSVIVTDESDELLVEGTDYEYIYSEDEMIEPGVYEVEVLFKGNYAGSKTLTFTIGAGKTESITTTATQKGTMKLSWEEVEGATGYRVYIYKTVGGKTRKRAASVEGTSYTLTKDYAGKALEMGAEYKIAITAYTKLDDGTVIHAAAGVAKTFTQTPGRPNVKATSTSKGKVNLSWTNVVGEDGYTIMYSTSKNGTYKKLTGTKEDIAKFTASLTSGKTYYFKARAYAKVDGETIRGNYGTVASVKVK